MRLHLPFTLHDAGRDRHRNRVYLKTLTKMEVFKTIQFRLSCTRRNRIDMNTVTVLARDFISLGREDNECLGTRSA